ncbi:MAG: hypothetical protein GX074_04595 [Erysipelothrix sp.]|nr:hypothetical protein [Erysipelothrix sp.]
MKKFIIIFSLGISLMIAGGVVFAYELSEFTTYDIVENELNLPVVSNTVDYDISDFKTQIAFYDYSMNGIFPAETGLGSSSNSYSNLDIVEDESQVLGTISVNVTYLSNIGSSACYMSFYNEDYEEYSGRHHGKREGNRKGQHHSEMMANRNNRQTRRLSKEFNLDVTYPVSGIITCEYNGHKLVNNIFANDHFKMLMKTKQLPTVPTKTTIVINPSDADKIR